MRIVLVNWAKVWNGPAEGGGVNGYCQSLALELVARGHDVVSLCGGTTYVAAPGGEPGPCAIRRHPDWMGVRVFEVVNSPVLAPSVAQFADPAGEVSAPELEMHIRNLLVAVRPDVVHFHNLEGFSIGCVAAARRPHGDWPGAAVLFSLHNYHTVCPQVYLMHRDRRPCHGSDNGHRCAGCITACDPAAERRRRAAVSASQDTAPASEPRRVLPQLWRELRTAVGLGGGSAAPAAPAPGSQPLPGEPVDGPASVHDPLPMEGEENRGRSGALLNRAPGPHDFDFLSPEWAPLTNEALPEPPSTLPPNEYGRRRAAMVRMLSECDRVLAVSEFVRSKFEALGVDPEVLRTMHIGTRLRELAERNRDLLIGPPAGFDRPLRLVFLGYNNWYKGLPMLADSLELLTPEVLSKIHLSVYALNGQSIRPRFRRLETRLAALTFQPGYDYENIPLILGNQDLGVVTSVWWDNAPQTVFELLACGVPVLAPRLGGIPDFVHDGRNGMLFRGNDRFDLARRLAEVVRTPEVLAELRRGVRAPKGMDEHAEELERLYSECLSSRLSRGAETSHAALRT